MARRLFVLISLAIALFVAACEGPGQGVVEPPAPLPTPTLPPQLGGVQHVGEPIDRPLLQTTEIVQNCGGGSEPIVKHPGLVTVSANSVEWEVGGQFGAGLRVGVPTFPVAVDLTGVIEVADRTKLEQNLQQAVAWDLPAAPGEIMTYVLSWNEQWQPATVEVRFSDQDVRHINVTYRTGVESNILSSNVQYCNGAPPPTGLSTIVLETPSPTIAGINCEFFPDLLKAVDVIQQLYEGQSLAGVQARLLYPVEVPIGWIVHKDGVEYQGPVQLEANVVASFWSPVSCRPLSSGN